MKTISKMLIAVALMPTAYPSSSWAQTYDQGIHAIAGAGAFTANIGQLGYTAGRLTHLRIARNGLQKNVAALTGWTGLITYTNSDDGSPGSQTCTYLDKTGNEVNGFYVFRCP